MTLRTKIILSVVLLLRMTSVAQDSFADILPFHDSIDFYLKHKIKEINIKDINHDTLSYKTKLTFNKKTKSIKWCSNRSGKWDCDQDAFYPSNFTPTSRFGLVQTYLTDNRGRLIKKTIYYSRDSLNSLQVFNYYYADSSNKRLSLIIHSFNSYGKRNKGIDSTIFHYENNRLNKLTRSTTFHSDYNTNNLAPERRIKTFYYDYFPDGKIKYVCDDSPACISRSELLYKYY